MYVSAASLVTIPLCWSPAWVLWANESVCRSFKRDAWVVSSPLSHPSGWNPLIFTLRCCGGSFSVQWYSRLESQVWAVVPCSTEGTITAEIFLRIDSQLWHMGLWPLVLLSSPNTSLKMALLYIRSYRISIQLVFWWYFRLIVLYFSCNFMCLWEEGSTVFIYSTIL